MRRDWSWRRGARHGATAGDYDLDDINGRTLSCSPIFEGIPDDAIESLCSRGRVVVFEANHQLFERGNDAHDLMILQEGVVELLLPLEIMGVTRDVTMESKDAGEVVAWSALVAPYRFTLSARCATKCTLTSFSREMLHARFQEDPQNGYLFMRNLAGVIGRRLQAMQTMWVHDLQAGATKRYH